MDLVAMKHPARPPFQLATAHRRSRPLQAAPVQSREGEVLAALSRIIDPDFGMNIVDCGFVKDLAIDAGAGSVAFRLELTTPACPIKDEFERQVGAAFC